MKRRDFIKTAVSLPAAGSLAMCNSCTSQQPPAPYGPSGPDLAKALQAMLCIQRKSWEQGTAMQAFIESGRDDLLVLMAREAALRQWPDGRLAMVGSDQAVTDPGSNGPGLLRAYHLTGEATFKTAADAMYRYFKDAAPKTADGILHHLTNVPQVWSDSIFMAPPFLAMMGDFDEAVKQIDGYRHYLWNPEKKLFSHIWDTADKAFKRSDCWGGGNGWAAAAYALILETMPGAHKARRSKLMAYAQELLDGCLACMRPDGLFHDVVDRPDTFVETNLSQMLAFSIYKGVYSGWLDKQYRPAADTMRQAALAKIDTDCFVQGACGSPTFDRPGTSAEAQAFLLMMEAARTQLIQQETA